MRIHLSSSHATLPTRQPSPPLSLVPPIDLDDPDHKNKKKKKKEEEESSSSALGDVLSVSVADRDGPWTWTADEDKEDEEGDGDCVMQASTTTHSVPWLIRVCCWTTPASVFLALATRVPIILDPLIGNYIAIAWYLAREDRESMMAIDPSDRVESSRTISRTSIEATSTSTSSGGGESGEMRRIGNRRSPLRKRKSRKRLSRREQGWTARARPWNSFRIISRACLTGLLIALVASLVVRSNLLWEAPFGLVEFTHSIFQVTLFDVPVILLFVAPSLFWVVHATADVLLYGRIRVDVRIRPLESRGYFLSNRLSLLGRCWTRLDCVGREMILPSVCTAMLFVTLGCVLDPAAIHLGWWRYHLEVNQRHFFHMPYSACLGWFVLGFTLSVSVRLLWSIFHSGTHAYLPPLASTSATAYVAGVDSDGLFVLQFLSIGAFLIAHNVSDEIRVTASLGVCMPALFALIRLYLHSSQVRVHYPHRKERSRRELLLE